MDWQAPWIWTPEPTAPRNAYVRFRREFAHPGGPATLHLTADTRYVLYVNGEWLGQGPVRAWPAHWHYDSYDLTPHLRPGINVIGVLVHHFGDGTFQSLDGPPGLLAQLEGGDLGSGEWRCRIDAARVSAAPRISCQLGWEEQYDARAEEPWLEAGFDESGWARAVLSPEAEAFHGDLQPRGIPFLTHEPWLPQRVISVETVRAHPHHWTIHAKPYLFPAERSANMTMAHAYLATRLWSPAAAEVRLWTPHKHPQGWKVNGADAVEGRAVLRAGWNDVLLNLRGFYHIAEFCMVIDGAPDGVRLDGWAVCGPFGLGPDDEAAAAGDKDDSLVVGRPLVPEATVEAGEALWASGDVAGAVGQPWWQPVVEVDLPAVDAFVTAYTDQPLAALRSTNVDGLLSGAEWTVIDAPASGDVRLLLDYGREVVGYQRFEIDAPEGTIVDAHNFEFIQPDGRYNFAEGMNNSFRYVCRAGRQRYQTYLRRGFRYTYLILRGMTGPVRLRKVEAVFASYPQTRRGQFACSDSLLEKIWEVGAHSLRCCAEDTYTDCPTYEQTHWVGDARNEALVDAVVNGDPRLWYRCLEQVGQSLERSPITESEVPSGWQNLLPAWSCLWMRSCREYYLHSGDRDGAERLLDFIDRNVDGIAAHTNVDGLFEIRAWNMFDWAELDTPNQGVVTHQNCMAVQALNESAELALWLGQRERCSRWQGLAARLKAAINRHLWVEEKHAYADCLRVNEGTDRLRGPWRELVPSPVFSQQTQTVAVMAGVAEGERAAACRAHLHEPPEGFVRAGSPFFEFFLLEALQQEHRDEEFLTRIREDWGFMVAMGATTFWEMWSGRGGRLTRSHCHGWSAAPTFFLSAWVLGVRPGGPGYQPCIIEPHTGDLRWCRGVVPTPLGDVSVQWEREAGKRLTVRIIGPADMEWDLRLPDDAHVMVTQGGRRCAAQALG
jgi:hypothetical protein